MTRKRKPMKSGMKSAPMLDDENWAPIEGFDGLYFVSKDGRVFSVRSGKVLKPGAQTSGYLFVFLYERDWRKNKAHRIHRLVAQAFIKNESNHPEVNHKNGIKSDNRLENLEWCSRQYNVQHSVSVIGRNEYNRDGSKNPNAKKVASFSDAMMTIRGSVFGSIVEAAKEVGVFRTAISQALRTGCRSAGFYWRYE